MVIDSGELMRGINELERRPGLMRFLGSSGNPTFERGRSVRHTDPSGDFVRLCDRKSGTLALVLPGHLEATPQNGNLEDGNTSPT